MNVPTNEDKKMRTIITYGTFDLLHVGHLNILEKLKGLGSYLIVGVSTDEFNQKKGKQTVIPFADRARLVSALSCVDKVIPENTWEQKRSDILENGASIFGIGEDWKGKFDSLNDICEVVYLPRTQGISTTDLKESLRTLKSSHINEIKKALDIMSSIVEQLD